MDELLEDLAAQHAELDGLLAGLADSTWSAPSRCAGWSVSDVVLHLAQTDEMALASLEGRLADHLEAKAAVWVSAGSVDDGAGLLVAAERGQPPEAVLRRWRGGAQAMRSAFATHDPHARVTWVAGELATRTLATTRLAESWIHTWDVAAGAGVVLPVPDRVQHIARLAWRTLPYAFAQAGRTLTGAVCFALTSPTGSTWTFGDEGGGTVVRGSAFALCQVAGQRVPAADAGLTAEGPDGPAVLELVRTFA
jgi:uncharacterized protein (TIGR03084 family)